MNTCKELIQDYAAIKDSFEATDLWEWLSSKGISARNTMNCTLSRMINKGDIVRIACGTYAAADGKQIFNAVLTNKEMEIARVLKEHFPFAPVCIYNGITLAPLQHHLFENNMTYIETDRTAIESFFNFLKERLDNVWLTPDSELVSRYINLSDAGIIIKPLITEAPLQYVNGIPSPTIEKLLIDIQKDHDFSYLQGYEYERLWDNAQALYYINSTRLKRYAKRRGLILKDNV